MRRGTRTDWSRNPLFQKFVLGRIGLPIPLFFLARWGVCRPGPYKPADSFCRAPFGSGLKIFYLFLRRDREENATCSLPNKGPRGLPKTNFAYPPWLPSFYFSILHRQKTRYAQLRRRGRRFCPGGVHNAASIYKASEAFT